MYMTPRSIIGFLLLALFLSLLFLAAGPYWAMSRLGTAFTTGDTEALERRIAMESVRDSLIQDLVYATVGADTPSPDDPPSERFRFILARQAAETAVNALVTHQALGTLARGIRPDRAVPRARRTTTYVPATDAFDNADTAFIDLSTFEAVFRAQDGSPIRFVFRRSGLSWILTEVRLR